MSLRRKVLKHRERYRTAFFAPPPTPIHFYEMFGGQGGGVGAVVIAEAPPELSLLDACFTLLRFWRETATQGWAGGPSPADPEALWTSLLANIETGYRGYASEIYRYDFTPMKVVDFDRAMRQVIETCYFDRPPEAKRLARRDNARDVEVREGFRPPIAGPYREAIAVLHKWNERVFVASTDTQRICVVWSTGA